MCGDAVFWTATGSIATFLAVLVALCKEEIVRCWRHPALEARINLSAPDCHKTQMTLQDLNTRAVIDQADCYYFRLWVENIGNQRAEKVQVFVSKVSKQHADGTFVKDNSFISMNLKWANSHEIFAEGISPKMGKHCDFFHVVDPSKRSIFGADLPDVAAGKTILQLDLEVAPLTLSHLIPPGTYEIELKLAAANVSPIIKKYVINLTGTWNTDESRMFSDGIGIRELN